MPGHLRASTPQFRTALIRKLRNLYPGYEPDFMPADRGVAFRMKDKNGRLCSSTIGIVRNNGDTLQRRWLEARLKSAGFPPAKNLSSSFRGSRSENPEPRGRKRVVCPWIPDRAKARPE